MCPPHALVGGLLCIVQAPHHLVPIHLQEANASSRLSIDEVDSGVVRADDSGSQNLGLEGELSFLGLI
jgi:hypothetical protein